MPPASHAPAPSVAPRALSFVVHVAAPFLFHAPAVRSVVLVPVLFVVFGVLSAALRAAVPFPSHVLAVAPLSLAPVLSVVSSALPPHIHAVVPSRVHVALSASRVPVLVFGVHSAAPRAAVSFLSHVLAVPAVCVAPVLSVVSSALPRPVYAAVPFPSRAHVALSASRVPVLFAGPRAVVPFPSRVLAVPPFFLVLVPPVASCALSRDAVVAVLVPLRRDDAPVLVPLADRALSSNLQRDHREAIQNDLRFSKCYSSDSRASCSCH